jgi:hypothetical protein
MKNADHDEMASTELILSIDVRSCSGKIVFRIIKVCKSRDYTDGKSALVFDKLKKKLDTIYAPSPVKTESAFSQSKLVEG